MKKIIPYKYEINPNLYVLYEILECITNKLYLPNIYYKKIQSLSTDIGNTLFSFPNNCEELDFIGENVEVTSYYQERNNSIKD